MLVVKSNSYQKLRLMLNVVVIFVLFCVLRVAYNLGSVAVLSADSSTYVELPTFCTSEWLRSFNFVISFYFLVSF